MAFDPFELEVMVQVDRIAAAIGRHTGSAGEVIDTRDKLVTGGLVVSPASWVEHTTRS